MMRRAFTLVEVIIAVAILGTAMIVIMQLVTSGSQHEAASAAQDDLAEDVDRITKLVGQDIMISGWAVSASASFAGGTGLPSAADADRSSAYFPYVLSYSDGQEDPAISGGRFRHARISAAFLPDSQAIARSLTGGAVPSVPTGWNLYRQASIAPSHALVVLALQHGSWSTARRSDQSLALAFGQRDNSDLTLWQTPDNHAAIGVLFPSPYTETYSGTTPSGAFTRIASASTTTAYGLVQDSMVLQESAGQFSLLPQWETINAPVYDGTDGYAVDSPEHFTGYREYMYVVVRPPSSQSGRFGRLVRARKERIVSTLVPGTEVGQLLTDPGQPFGFVVDRVLSDNVIRILAETSRSAPAFVAPNLDQIRLTVWMLRPILGSNDGGRIPRMTSLMFTMRTEARSTIKGVTDLSPESVLVSSPHPSYPVAP